VVGGGGGGWGGGVWLWGGGGGGGGATPLVGRMPKDGVLQNVKIVSSETVRSYT